MPQFLISHSGTIAGVEDMFTHTLVVNGAGDEQTVAEAARAAWLATAWSGPSALRGNTSSTVAYTQISAAQILSLSEGTLSAAHHALITPPLPATGSGEMPAQVAACVSLTAGQRPNGTPLKGRFYLPPPDGANIDDDGLFPTSYRNLVADQIVAYLADLTAAGLDAGVWSRSLAQFNTLTAVRVGNKPDTIRTRRNAEPEEYSVRAV